MSFLSSLFRKRPAECSDGLWKAFSRANTIIQTKYSNFHQVLIDQNGDYSIRGGCSTSICSTIIALRSYEFGQRFRHQIITNMEISLRLNKSDSESVRFMAYFNSENEMKRDISARTKQTARSTAGTGGKAPRKQWNSRSIRNGKVKFGIRQSKVKIGTRKPQFKKKWTK